jgi:hypothetical protein
MPPLIYGTLFVSTCSIWDSSVGTLQVLASTVLVARQKKFTRHKTRRKGKRNREPRIDYRVNELGTAVVKLGCEVVKSLASICIQQLARRGHVSS